MGSPKREKGIRLKLMEYTTEKKSYWILWKYGVLYRENKSFEEFSKKFLGGMNEEYAEQYLLEEDVQKAIKHLHKILHTQKMVELYNIYFERAKDDTNAFKAFADFSKTFFAEDKESDLAALLNGVDIDEQ
ncbi:hypothetical protein Amet_2838 [Alkaliphilus metalliredigens QYMF]|uniref:Uncharacterized protein n=1 Tax=Alkaliphilus metalliredigens (strain QYMF) TaxID=293826 RepID=A6TS20_ALKMQ|nr:hypothetical protein [Alkaliphilus metalliredigens]ABR48988.1 hypothetical protein Amet_2838 [Alkaliphilus metalliredigens QYMF]